MHHICRDNGQISGRVLVYRNPGLHFGDVHVMTARYVEELADVVGDAKYGIFFSTKGPRSAATEIANGDFDGDMYWVSINRKVGFQMVFLKVTLWKEESILIVRSHIGWNLKWIFLYGLGRS